MSSVISWVYKRLAILWKFSFVESLRSAIRQISFNKNHSIMKGTRHQNSTPRGIFRCSNKNCKMEWNSSSYGIRAEDYICPFCPKPIIKRPKSESDDKEMEWRFGIEFPTEVKNSSGSWNVFFIFTSNSINSLKKQITKNKSFVMEFQSNK